MRVLLAALTGMGNSVLGALLASPLADGILVVTRRETSPFPHYPCGNLAAECREAGLDCREDIPLDTAAGLELVRAFAPDLLLTATYHRILPRAVIAAVRHAVNIHPSLLPAYQGPTPTNWAVAKAEAESGVSFHLLEEEIDRGGLLMQHRVPIGGLTDGAVREASSALAARHVPELLEGLAQGRLAPRPMGGGGSRQPRFTSPQGVALLRSGEFRRRDIERAVTPYPGTAFLKEHNL